jgi:hypothetical protein
LLSKTPVENFGQLNIPPRYSPQNS